jgi:hypothetical protein
LNLELLLFIFHPMLDPQAEFLTIAECHTVDAALLTAHGKFNARVAIYALRSLKQIAAESGVAIAQLDPTAIAHWVEADPSLQSNLDSNFRTFWTKLVLSAQQPLAQMAAQAGGTIEQLTIQQVIAWFEAVDQQRV